MKPRTFGWSAALVVAALSLAAPTYGQGRGHEAGGGGDSGGARANTGGGSSGTAVSRGSDAGSASAPMPSGATSGAPSGATTGFGSSTGTSNTSPSAPSPMGGIDSGGARGRNFAASGARGLPRNEAAASAVDRAVPGGSRPNLQNSPVIGTAVPRGTQPTGVNAGPNQGWYYWNTGYYNYNGIYPAYGYPGLYSYYPFSSYYPMSPYFWNPYALYGYGAYGLGSFYYDPMWWGAAAGNAWGAGGSGYSGDTGGSYVRGDSPSGVIKGGLKLKVTPKDAEVYVDGALQGTVDEFDGAFQRLSLPVGPHHIELKAKGYEPLNFDVMVEPRDTIAYHGTMQPLQAK